MAIEFLNRIFNVQPVKKEIALTQQRKKKGQNREEKKEDEDKGQKEDGKKGKVDIRI